MAEREAMSSRNPWVRTSVGVLVALTVVAMLVSIVCTVLHWGCARSEVRSRVNGGVPPEQTTLTSVPARLNWRLMAELGDWETAITVAS